MIRFQYKALDGQQDVKNGCIEAQSREEAALLLQRNGWTVLALQPASVLSLHTMPARKVFGPSELANLTQQLATLLAAGQPLEKSVASLSRQQSKAPPRELLERVRERLKNGDAFARALEAERDQFSSLYRSMVSAGEASGSLHQTLRQLGDYLERSYKLRTAVINAMIYPAFLLASVLGSLILMLTFVIPQFIPVFSDMGVELPTVTRAILWISQALSNNGIYVLILSALCLLGAIALFRKPDFRQWFDLKCLQAPVAGLLFRQGEAARITRTLGTLLSNGVGLVQGLHIVERVSPNRAIQQQVLRAIDVVREGSTLSAAMSQPRLFPDLAIEMIAVGEMSGRMGDMLLEVAEIFDHETKRTIDRLMAAFTPVLTLVMAGLVMLIMLAIMMPLMSLTQNI